MIIFLDGLSTNLLGGLPHGLDPGSACTEPGGSSSRWLAYLSCRMVRFHSKCDFCGRPGWLTPPVRSLHCNCISASNHWLNVEHDAGHVWVHQDQCILTLQTETQLKTASINHLTNCVMMSCGKSAHPSQPSADQPLLEHSGGLATK